MFDALKHIAQKAKKLNENKLLKEALSNSSIQADILELNTEEQLFDKGIDSAGISLGEYAPATIFGTVNFKGKIEKGQPIDRVTLKDTGDFYKSFKFKNGANSFTIKANDEKDGAVLLTKQYGDEILGLTNESMETLIRWLKPTIQRLTFEQLTK